MLFLLPLPYFEPLSGFPSSWKYADQLDSGVERSARRWFLSPSSSFLRSLLFPLRFGFFSSLMPYPGRENGSRDRAFQRGARLEMNVEREWKQGAVRSRYGTASLLSGSRLFEPSLSSCLQKVARAYRSKKVWLSLSPSLKPNFAKCERYREIAKCIGIFPGLPFIFGFPKAFPPTNGMGRVELVRGK